MALSSQELMDAIDQMTVLELSEFVKALQDKYGVTAAAPMAAGVGAGGGGEAAAAPEEKTSFDVILTGAGEKKIQVIKVVREIVPTLALKEAKELVDTAPQPVRQGVSKEEADAIKAKLVEQGASVEIK